MTRMCCGHTGVHRVQPLQRSSSMTTRDMADLPASNQAMPHRIRPASAGSYTDSYLAPVSCDRFSPARSPMDPQAPQAPLRLWLARPQAPVEVSAEAGMARRRGGWLGPERGVAGQQFARDQDSPVTAAAHRGAQRGTGAAALRAKTPPTGTAGRRCAPAWARPLSQSPATEESPGPNR
jgi:hypothetical protein